MFFFSASGEWFIDIVIWYWILGIWYLIFKMQMKCKMRGRNAHCLWPNIFCGGGYRHGAGCVWQTVCRHFHWLLPAVAGPSFSLSRSCQCRLLTFVWAECWARTKCREVENMFWERFALERRGDPDGSCCRLEDGVKSEARLQSGWATTHFPWGWLGSSLGVFSIFLTLS